MKKLLVILIFSGTVLQGFTQQKLEKYEDALPRILTLPPSGALAQLKRYLPLEPQNPSIYFQMAVIYEGRFKDSDPIKDYAYKIGNAQEALKAYARTEQFITEKDVRKNEENYFNFGKIDEKGRISVEFDTIRKHMDQIKIELNKFVANMPTIYDKFTKSFSSYDRAHKEFTKILGEYPTFKDLYLLYDDEVDKRFTRIKEDFQASTKYWEEYKSASDTFDIGYDQKLSVKPVAIYRLDGLESKINFLQDEIVVWDYAGWVDITRATIRAEIDKLRRDLVAENLRLDKRIEQAEPDFIRNQFEPVKVSKEVLFTLRKYDLNSVIEPIFLFKEKKHDLIYQELLSKNLDTATNVDTERKLYLYGQMVNRIKEADSVLNDVRKTNTKASLEKYSDFINAHYNGQPGITDLVTKERQNNKTDAADYVSSIQNRLYEILATDSISPTINHKKKTYALQPGLSMEKDLLTPQPITTHRIENFDGSLFLGGIFKNEKENKTQAFVCGVTPESKMGWYNDYLLQMDSATGFDTHTRLGAMQSIPGGLAIILHGVDTSGTRMNHLMMLDEKGQVTLSRRLLLNQFPRTISYNERTNTLFVTYKGDDYLDDILAPSELIMASYSIYGDLLWQKRLTYKGDVADVVNIDQGYMVVGNYNELKGLDGKILRAGSSNTDTKAFALKINYAGEITNLKGLNYGTSYFANKTYKVSDDCINVFGSSGPYAKKVAVDDTPGSAVHMILNKDLEVLASSLK
ncbi:MAG: hypothetical protein RIC35_00100 [Marinoscillum sp.]